MDGVYYKKADIWVSQEVRGMYPEILIEYLCGLVSSETGISQTCHFFKLSAENLNGRIIQQIVHTSGIGVSEVRRVFGYLPVDGVLAIVFTELGYCMVSLSDGQLVEKSCECLPA